MKEGRGGQVGHVGQARRVGQASSYSSLVQIDVAALSHPGHVRWNNEDDFLVTRLGRTLETMTTSLSDAEAPKLAEEVNYVMIVADGMGGHAAGEVASRMALSAIVSLALDIPDWILKLERRVMRAKSSDRTRATRPRQVGALLVKEGRAGSGAVGHGHDADGRRRTSDRDLCRSRASATGAPTCFVPAACMVSPGMTAYTHCS